MFLVVKVISAAYTPYTCTWAAGYSDFALYPKPFHVCVKVASFNRRDPKDRFCTYASIYLASSGSTLTRNIKIQVLRLDSDHEYGP